MGWREAESNIRAKQGQANSIDPEFHADQIAEIGSDIDDLFFEAFTNSRVPLAGAISADDTAPTLATDLAFAAKNGGFELVTTGPWANTGAVLNNTGFDLDCIGTFDFYPNNTGTTSRIDLWSEVSPDGVEITVNGNAGRSMEISSSGESSQTKSSKIADWKNGDMLRFAFTDTGGGSINLERPVIAARGGTVQSPSFAWQFAVVGKSTPA